jgi:hypothetical protein
VCVCMCACTCASGPWAIHAHMDTYAHTHAHVCKEIEYDRSCFYLLYFYFIFYFCWQRRRGLGSPRVRARQAHHRTGLRVRASRRACDCKHQTCIQIHPRVAHACTRPVLVYLHSSSAYYSITCGIPSITPPLPSCRLEHTHTSIHTRTACPCCALPSGIRHRPAVCVCVCVCVCVGW